MSSYSGRFKLKIDADGRTALVPLRLGSITIGRDAGSAVRLDDRNVSRRHLRLVRDKKIVWAEDLSSANGSTVNGEPLRGRKQIFRHDVIRIGDYALELHGEALRGRDEETTERTLAPDIEDTEVTAFPEASIEVTEIVRPPLDVEPEEEPTLEPTMIVRGMTLPALEPTDPAPAWLRLFALFMLLAVLLALMAAGIAWLAKHNPNVRTPSGWVTPIGLIATGSRAEADLPPMPEPEPELAALSTAAPEPETPVAEPPRKKKRSAKTSSAAVVRSSPLPSESAEAAAERLNRRAEKLVSAGITGAAKPLLKRCTREYPGFARCHRTLGVLYAKLGDAATAAYHYYQRYIDLAPRAPEAAAIRRLLRDYRGAR